MIELKTKSITITVFAELKEIFGQSKFVKELETPIYVSDLLDILIEDHHQFKLIKENIDNKYAIFVNGIKAKNVSDTKIKPLDEIAILPPVGGG